MALPPPAPGFLAPPAWPVALDWTEEEQRALESGMQRYPADRFDAVQRYVKVAAMLPRKSVRDVALRVRWTFNQHMLKKRKPGELLPAGVGAAVGKKPLAHGGLLPPKAPTLPPVPMVRVWHSCTGRFVCRTWPRPTCWHAMRSPCTTRQHRPIAQLCVSLPNCRCLACLRCRPLRQCQQTAPPMRSLRAPSRTCWRPTLRY